MFNEYEKYVSLKFYPKHQLLMTSYTKKNFSTIIMQFLSAALILIKTLLINYFTLGTYKCFTRIINMVHQ